MTATWTRKEYVQTKQKPILLITSLLCAVILLLSPFAYTKEVQRYKIDKQALSSALAEFAKISNADYIAPVSLFGNKLSTPVSGEMSAEEALNILLLGTNLKFRRNDSGTFLIFRKKKVVIQSPFQHLEEVVVTAQKREQFNQDIPVTVSTLAGESLSQTGKTNTRDLFIVVPAVSYHGAISSAGQGMRIRGVGTGIIASGIEQSVGTIIDGVVTGPSGSGLQELWDIERVEILKGPQGTLFGKNVSAGAINQVTADPTESFNAMIKSRYETEYKSNRLDGFISGPITENISYRLSAFSTEQQQGTVRNIVRNEQENIKDRWGIRGKLHLENNNLWAKLNISYDTLDESCCARVFSHLEEASFNTTTIAWAVPALERNNIQATEENRYAMTEGALREKAETWHGVFELGKTFHSGHTIKSISGYRKWDHKSINDPDNIDRDIFSIVSDFNTIEIFSQEFQLFSPEGNNWEYLIGLYFYQQEFPKTELIGGGFDFSGTTGVTSIDSTIDTQHIALFSHSTYYFTPQASVFAGLRFLKENIEAVGQQQGDNWLWPTNYPTNQVKTSDSDYVGTFGFQYFPSDDNQIYASVTRGYKGKAIDNPSNSIFFRAPQTLENRTILTAEDAVLNPETVVSFEIGAKNYFLNHSLLFNATLYHAEFRDFQASAFDGSTSSFRLTNAGVVQSKGLEIDLQIKPWQGAFISFSAAWVDTIFEEFNGAPCQVSQMISGICSAATGGQDLSGKPVNENPRNQYYLQFRQDIELTEGSVFFDTRYAWRDDVIFGGDLDPNTQQDAFGLLDISAGITFNHYTVSLFANNATNENYANRIIDAPVWRGAYQRYPGEERTLGVEISYRLE